jgi:hypothetical protein
MSLIFFFSLIQSGLKSMINRTRGEHANHYTTDAVKNPQKFLFLVTAAILNGGCCFSTKHTALRRKSKDWLARNQDNVSE